MLRLKLNHVSERGPWKRPTCPGDSCIELKITCSFFKHLFRRRSKKTSKLRVTGLCVGNTPLTGEFPTQRASSAESVSIWWRHHVLFGTDITMWEGANDHVDCTTYMTQYVAKIIIGSKWTIELNFNASNARSVYLENHTWTWLWTQMV